MLDNIIKQLIHLNLCFLIGGTTAFNLLVHTTGLWIDHSESELLLVIGDAEGIFFIASYILVSVIYIQLRYRNRARLLIFCISLAWDREPILGWYISLPFHTILLPFWRPFSLVEDHSNLINYPNRQYNLYFGSRIVTTGGHYTF